MKDKIKPAIVLTVICVVASLLLVFANEMTKNRIAEQKSQKFGNSVEALFGECEITLLDENFGNSDILNIAVTTNKETAIQVSADGYAKDGINILVGINKNGEISGIEFISLGETPGLGSKIKDEASFREQFIGLSDTIDGYDAISGATFSSKGMKEAINTALDVYNENKEAILNGGK